MTAKEMWADFTAGHPEIREAYEAWAFGDAPDALARLVLCGVKTATSSALPLYALEGAPLPRVGEYSVILNSRNEAVCVIRTTKTAVAPFRDVGERHAYLEGEGDRSLAYWRRVHEKFFTDCMAAAGKAFDMQMPVVCEEFTVVYTLSGQGATCLTAAFS